MGSAALIQSKTHAGGWPQCCCREMILCFDMGVSLFRETPMAGFHCFLCNHRKRGTLKAAGNNKSPLSSDQGRQCLRWRNFTSHQLGLLVHPCFHRVSSIPHLVRSGFGPPSSNLGALAINRSRKACGAYPKLIQG